MDEERVRSADEERDADAAEPEDLAELPTADLAVDVSADEALTEAPAESEGLADWLERVRRSAPGLLIGGPSMRAAAPPRVPESESREETQPAQSVDITAVPESSTSPSVDVSSVSPIEESPTSVPPAAVIAEMPATSKAEEISTSAPSESRLLDAVEEAEAVATPELGPAETAPAEIEQPKLQPSVVNPPKLPVESPADQAPPTRDAWPVTAGHSTAMATDDLANDRLAPAEPQQPSEPTNERRIGDLEPVEYHQPPQNQQPLDYESRAVEVAAPQPQAVTSLARTGDWPQRPPAPSAGPPALVVSEPSHHATQPSEFSPRGEWVSPWPTLPDSSAADDESADPATALRERDRWTRLLREQESA